MTLAVHPLTPDRWTDLERLFGPRGAYAGCWCMWPRTGHRAFTDGQRDAGAGNRVAFRTIVDSGEIPGLLMYEGGEAVGWVAVRPRETYSRLLRSRILKPPDDSPVWSIVCLFVARAHRRQGLTGRLIEAAVQWAGEQGATIVEGYPIDPTSPRLRPEWSWWGFAPAFERAGFVEVVRRSPNRPIVRRVLQGQMPPP